MDKPKKWTEVYPHGTKQGDAESKFFKALARHPKYDWRSTGAIVKASGLPQEKVEEIIDKYINYNPPLIFPHPKNDAHWGYWERVPDMLKTDNRDLSTKDKDNRIGKHLGADIQISDLDLSNCSDEEATAYLHQRKLDLMLRMSNDCLDDAAEAAVADLHQQKLDLMSKMIFAMPQCSLPIVRLPLLRLPYPQLPSPFIHFKSGG